ncbi:MAG: hypothetical protein DLM68_18895 [Hyphomicrobiales bacterium]|nr:MAG: hypothetical protein DLM68_18895 [Hyphomicrobiales bacterium]
MGIPRLFADDPDMEIAGFLSRAFAAIDGPGHGKARLPRVHGMRALPRRHGRRHSHSTSKERLPLGKPA